MSHLISVELPEASIVTGEIVVLAFIGEDGVERWDTRVGTQMTQSQIVGLLEMAKHAYLSRRDGED
jgi:hypothetical protein